MAHPVSQCMRVTPRVLYQWHVHTLKEETAVCLIASSDQTSQEHISYRLPSLRPGSFKLPLRALTALKLHLSYIKILTIG